MLRKTTIGGALGLAASLYYYYHQSVDSRVLLASEKVDYFPFMREVSKPHEWLAHLPTREQQVDTMANQSEQLDGYDVLVIGGGATGASVALDATSRGLKTALIEKYDYASGTSSRSTKLIHGGMRYLQKAITKLDLEQYKMVKEALGERAHLIESAPHLSYQFPIMLPIYAYWQIPYYWLGVKCYDIIAGRKLLKSSYYIGKRHALELFPMLKKDRLVGALVYYDGQHNDARMNLSIAITAARLGANVANYVEAYELIHDDIIENGVKKRVVVGAQCRDTCRNKEFKIKAKCVVNACGPYTDNLRQMDDSSQPNICQPSSGVHIVLPDYYSPQDMGLLDPHTKDGRVIFFLPWQKHTMAGTTDSPCQLTYNPSPSEEDVSFIIEEIRNYLNDKDVQVRRGDVLSVWSGIRPLVIDPNKESTQSLARNHVVHVSDSRLITIAGGKWTTCRLMAEETMNTAIKACNLKPKRKCVTKGLLIEGAHNWTPTSFIRLAQDYGIETEVAQHLSNTYGDQAEKVADMSTLTGKRWPVIGNRLHQEFPYIDAEVRYAVHYEQARTAVDVIARRTRIAFLNVLAAEESLGYIVDLMSEELKWSQQEKDEQMQRAHEFLKREMGLDLKYQMKINMPINFTKDEISSYIKKFRRLDKNNKGYITHKDLRTYLKKDQDTMQIPESELHMVLSEVDTNKNGLIELDEFLQLMSAMKTGIVGIARFPKVSHIKNKFSPVRSGGGV